MRDFELVLDECLDQLESGASDVETCLTRNPEYASRLRPILLTAERFEVSQDVYAPEALKRRARARLVQYMQAVPRTRRTHKAAVMRFAMGLAVIMLALVTAGTVHAQNVLPGDLFHGWKLASEQAWRMVSSDPLGTDIAIAERRLDELIAVQHDPLLQAAALKAYLEASARLTSEMDAVNQERIQSSLVSQRERLLNTGILVPGIENEAPTDIPVPGLEDETLTDSSDIPAITPTPATPTPAIPTPGLLPTLPIVDPTELPDLIPDVDITPLLP